MSDSLTEISASPLSRCKNLLSDLVVAMAANGHVGEERAAKLLYLALTTRLFSRPVSVWVRGPSAAGKSRLVAEVLKFFPNTAYVVLTSMSPKALIYSNEPLQHRHLVICETSGVSGQAAYLVRSLLSEGSLVYEVAASAGNSFQSRRIVRPGPTGLIITSANPAIDDELKTRLLPVPTSEAPEQTRRILKAHLNPAKKSADVTEWIELQRALVTAKKTVVLPFGERLANLVNPTVLRLRRDIPAFAELVKAHALIHSAHRAHDEEGRIVATVREDYAAVRELVADLINRAAGSTVAAKVRDTVTTVQSLSSKGGNGIMVRDLAEALGLDKSSTSRRVTEALEAGFLTNLEKSSGRRSKIVVAKRLPDQCEILPTVERLSGCTVAGEVTDTKGKETSDSSSRTNQGSSAVVARSPLDLINSDAMKRFFASDDNDAKAAASQQDSDMPEIPDFLDRSKVAKPRA